ncbi:MAG TPA: hypothetical protein VN673_11200, partial [Clostridia bacterium]|nr:hypothetical protein [Clostridia bacterium]
MENVHSCASQRSGSTPSWLRQALGSVELPQIFTVSEIAAAICRTRRAVYKALAGTTPTGRKTVRGERLDADAWSVRDLPEGLRSQLQAAAERGGYRKPEDVLAAPPALWQMPVPMELIPQEDQDRAVKLRMALFDLLPIQHTIAAGDLQERGLLEYRRVFGREISPRRWRELMDRTTERDGGRGEWQRLDIYIDNQAFHRPTASKPLSLENIHSPLDDVVKQINNPYCPALEDVERLKREVFSHFNLVTDNTDEPTRRAIKSDLLHYLQKAVPGLSANGKSLRRWFNDNYRAWLIDGKTEDRRIRSGNFRESICDECAKRLAERAADQDFNLTLTWSSRGRTDLLCPACKEKFQFNPQNKHHVPKSVRAKCTPEIMKERDRRLGSTRALSRGPTPTCDNTSYAPGDWFCADDTTFNHYFWYLDNRGEKKIGRGETLIWIDRRTGYVLHYTIVASVVDGLRTSYNGFHIRGGFLETHDLIGLPHVGLYLENGVWRSRMVDGEKRRKWDTRKWQDVEHGLRLSSLQLETPEMDVKHHKPRNPRSKPVEWVIRILQARMAFLPFYVGRNERTDRREPTQKALARIKTGQTDAAAAGMLSMEQYRDALDKVIAEYNDTVQNGETLRDSNGVYLSPAQAFQDGICGKPGIKARPLRKLTPEARALICTHKRLVPVTERGIEIKVNRKAYHFFGGD